MSALKGYSLTQIGLHWAVAVLIVFQLIFGEAMGDAWEAVKEGAVPQIGAMVRAHILAGAAVLLLAAWRLSLRRTRGVPETPSGSPLMMKAADWGHIGLYVLMVLAPVSGLAAWFGGIEAAAEVHVIFKPLLIVLVAGHVVASLFHQFVLKDGLLLRMKRPLD